MSFLSGAVHALGDVAAPVAKAAGAVGSVGGLIPNSEASRLTSIGNSIANPNITYTGSINPLSSNFHNTGGAAWVTAPASASTSGTTHPLADTTANTAGNGNGSTVNTAAAVDPAYSLYAGQAQSALQRALNAYNNSNASIGQQYGQQNAALQSALNQTTSDYNHNLTAQDQSRLTNDNQIHQNANEGYQSLLRVLGGMGAGGGSEAQYLVPQLVGQSMNQQLGGADQTAAQNKQALTSAYNTYLNGPNGEKQQQQKLNDWQTQQQQQNQATYNDAKGKLSNLLQALNAHADTAANLGSQVNSIDAGIPTVMNSVPTYTGQTPVYQAPNLSTFETPTAATPQVANDGSQVSPHTPYLSLILGQDQKKQATA